jgi:hypothetical protein
VQITRRVTRKHGRAFAEAFEHYANASLALSNAFEDTHVLTWPEDVTLENMTLAHQYMNLEDDILDLTFAGARDAIAESFVKAAREVLDRERARRRANKGRT